MKEELITLEGLDYLDKRSNLTTNLIVELL